jgi:transposase-like protein
MKNYPQIPTNRQIKKFFKKVLFGRNIFCPKCRSFKILKDKTRYRCKNCRRRFSLLSNTFLGNTKLELKAVWLIIWCFVNQIPVKQSQSLTELSEKAVRHWYDILRNQISIKQPVLKGQIQMDEVYLGGWGGRAVLAAKEIKTKQVVLHILESFTVYRTDIVDFIDKYIVSGSTVYTDSYPSYRGIDRMFNIAHKRDSHKKFEFHLTSEIEGLFGVLRTFIRRMYHHVSYEKLPEYLREFQARFSHKEYFKSVDTFLLKTLRLVTTG